MKNYWKRFAGWVTGSSPDVFWRARLKLAALYVGIVVFIVVIFSFALFYSVDKNIRDNFESSSSADEAQALAITKTTDQLQTIIIVIDLFTIAIAGGLSYFLAGRTLRPIKKSLERQKQFIADASHELRTPLSVARADLELMLREKEWNAQKMRINVKDVIEEIDTITALANDLLALARFDGEQGEKIFHPQKIDMRELVSRVAQKMKKLAENKEIIFSWSDFAPAFVLGDVGGLERVFTNVIGNAIRFTPQGGSIVVTMEHNGKSVVVKIKDTGVGIAPEDVRHVFDRFYRAEKARSRIDGGSGLGLSIAQSIVTAHKGMIHIQSALGHGTAVTVALPAMA